jgi:hypothetical protein
LTFYFLTEKKKLKFPITPPRLQNHGSDVLALHNLHDENPPPRLLVADYDPF